MNTVCPWIFPFFRIAPAENRLKSKNEKKFNFFHFFENNLSTFSKK